MGFLEVTVVWEGAVSDHELFEDGQSLIESMFLDLVKDDALDTHDLVEIYTLYHDHDIEDDDCECIQYETHHSPVWTNAEV